MEQQLQTSELRCLQVRRPHAIGSSLHWLPALVLYADGNGELVDLNYRWSIDMKEASELGH